MVSLINTKYCTTHTLIQLNPTTTKVKRPIDFICYRQISIIAIEKKGLPFHIHYAYKRISLAFGAVIAGCYCTYSHICKGINKHEHTHTPTHTHTHTYTHTHTCTYTHTYTHTPSWMHRFLFHRNQKQHRKIRNISYLKET